ncbi:MAG: Fur family transcriptional regulator [Pseudomonadota bacterium]
MAYAARPKPLDLLCDHGLRPTRQRRALAELLFVGDRRHFDAQTLHAEAADAGGRLSLATVYNALREFEQAGLIRRVAVPSERVWFDTDTGAHRHFFIEAENRVLDIPDGADIEPPPGYRVRRIDMVVHLQRIPGEGNDDD